MTYAIESSTPLEWLAEPWRPVLKWDANFQMLDDELKSWIVEPQYGARGIARRVFDRVVRVRAGALSDGRSDLLTKRGAERVFETLPQDYGHFSVPFHEHVLRGLRTEAPDYVLYVAHDLELEGSPHPGVAGVAVIRC